MFKLGWVFNEQEDEQISGHSKTVINIIRILLYKSLHL